ncbi:MAG: amidohydrolase [Planctomycetes bacterium]|nr:amidohydrolase [Planctomycetota bacterium]MBI3847242.1 amidohydrolase [Planctomycetota bacterium]
MTLVSTLLVALALGCATSQPKTAADVVIVAGRVVTMDAKTAVLEPGAVAVAGTKIVAVGSPADVAASVDAKRTIDAPDSVLIPGLVNVHTHVPMTLFRGFTDGLSLEAWLQTKIFPAEKVGVTPESVRAGTRLGLAEMIRGGTTTYCDMYYFEDAVAEETKRAGVRGVLGETVIGFPVADAPDTDASLALTESFMKHWHDDPLIVAAVAPHSTYTVSADVLKKCRALANKYDAPLVTHFCETRAEVADVQKRFGKTPIAYAESLDLFSGRTVAAHVVHPTADEIAILAKRHVGVGHCPQSNMKLGSGAAPVPALLKAGIALGLGTDGAASNDDLDLFEEIDTAAKLQKLVALDPTAIDAKTVFSMATIGGARALGLDSKIGSIEVGKEADLVLVGGTRAGLVPRGDVWGFLAYIVKASDVQTVMVAGHILLERGVLTTIDESAAAREVTAWRAKIEAALPK